MKDHMRNTVVQENHNCNTISSANEQHQLHNYSFISPSLQMLYSNSRFQVIALSKSRKAMMLHSGITKKEQESNGTPKRVKKSLKPRRFRTIPELLDLDNKS